MSKYEAGYSGNDTMRAKARKLFEPEFRNIEMDPMKAAIEKKKCLAYPNKLATGGNFHPMPEAQKNLYLPRKMSKGTAAANYRRGGNFDEGGTSNELGSGFMENSPINKTSKENTMSTMKRGGKMHKKHKGHKRGGKASGGSYSEGGYAEGGRAEGGYASGGNMYERHMVGESPSHHMPHINYEAGMRGMSPVHRATHTTRRHRGDDESHGTLSFNEGGHAENYYNNRHARGGMDFGGLFGSPSSGGGCFGHADFDQSRRLEQLFPDIRSPGIGAMPPNTFNGVNAAPRPGGVQNRFSTMPVRNPRMKAGGAMNKGGSRREGGAMRTGGAMNRGGMSLNESSYAQGGYDEGGRAEGGFAMGGVGKMRKGQMTGNCKPVQYKDDESHGEFRRRGGHMKGSKKR